MRCRQFWLSAMGVGLLACGPRISVGDLGDGATGQPGAGGTGTASGAGGVAAGAGGAPTGAGGAPTGAGGNPADMDAMISTGAGGVAVGAGGAPTGTGGNPADMDASISTGDCLTVQYPDSGFYGLNVLVPERTSVKANFVNNPYDFAALVTSGPPLRIKMTLLAPAAADSMPPPGWAYQPSGDWRVTPFDSINMTQIFQTADTGRLDEVSFFLYTAGEAFVEYFECGSSTPTRTKTITWSP